MDNASQSDVTDDAELDVTITEPTLEPMPRSLAEAMERFSENEAAEICMAINIRVGTEAAIKWLRLYGVWQQMRNAVGAVKERG